MARTVRSSPLETRAARHRLAPRGKPYWRLIEEGLHVGYRKPRGRRGSPAAAGKWVARIYIGEQKYQVQTIAEADDFSDANGTAILSFSQAQELARERRARLDPGGGDARGPYTVSMATADYFAHLENEGRGPRNIRDARYRYEAFIEPKLGTIELVDLTHERLRRWRDELAKGAPRLRTRKGEAQQHRKVDGVDGQRARRASANRTWSTLRAALNHAFQGDKITSDVAWRKVKPFKKVDAARKAYLSIAEANRLANASDPVFRSLVQAALQTGARYGELAQLRVNDFNPDAGTVHIRQSKSGKPRDIVLTDEGRALFKRAAVGRTGDELLFRNEGRVGRALERERKKLERAGEPLDGATVDDTAEWRPSEQKRLMEDACKRAKIKPPIPFHGLRHTWASLAAMNGVPLMVIAKNLGHADTRMVERHYGHLAPSYIAEAIRAGAPRFGFKPDRKVADLATHRRR